MYPNLPMLFQCFLCPASGHSEVTKIFFYVISPKMYHFSFCTFKALLFLIRSCVCMRYKGQSMYFFHENIWLFHYHLFKNICFPSFKPPIVLHTRQFYQHRFLKHIYFVLLVGDGRMGYAEEAPYDAIHVGAAAPVVPQAVSRFSVCVCVCFIQLNLSKLYR